MSPSDWNRHTNCVCLTPIGDVTGNETDDAAQRSQRNGVAALYMIFCGKLYTIYVYMYMMYMIYMCICVCVYILLVVFRYSNNCVV